MIKGSTIFLQAVVVIVGIGALAFLLGEPHFEGRNAHATLFEIYFHDPFLAYAYLASTPFFAALYQAFTVLGQVRRRTVFSREAVRALRIMKRCAFTLVGLVVPAELFIMLAPSDDRAGGVVMGLVVLLGASVLAAAAALGERILRDGMTTKSRIVSGKV